jgi:hypothetical protein
MRRRCPKSLWIVEGARHQGFLAFDPRGTMRTWWSS